MRLRLGAIFTSGAFAYATLRHYVYMFAPPLIFDTTFYAIILPPPRYVTPIAMLLCTGASAQRYYARAMRGCRELSCADA